jgi:hypothetical protein
MKRIVIVLFLSLFAFSANSQFRENVNISLFTGGYVSQQNAYNKGHWYGIYAEYMPIKTPNGFNFGFCALASQVGFKSNDTLNSYQGSSTDFGFGLAGGKYSEYFISTHSSYLGFNLMIKNSQDIGEGLSIGNDGKLGEYDMRQKDIMISGEININLLKNFGYRENLFPRTQLRLTFQEPLNSDKNSFWNNTPIRESMLWNKAAYGAELKQSIVQIGNFDLLLEPKLYTGYYHYKGDKSNWFGIGPELALKKRGWDDFLAVYFLVKQQLGDYMPHFNQTQFVFGLNFMPFNIKQY